MLIAVAATGCKSETRSDANGSDAAEADSIVAYTKRQAPAFSADSALKFVRAQVAFGPRVPGTESNRRCAQYIAETVKGFGVDTVAMLPFEATTFDGNKIVGNNIFAQISPDNPDRVLLVAHYDTRPWADNDHDTDKRSTPIDGANDGASGVGVLMELARQFSLSRPQIGVDLLFVDAEDYGNSDGWELHNDTWCLGSQHFAKNQPYTATNRPHYGIVLDMVGGLDARFHREYFSEKYAPSIVDRVWQTAAQLGYADKFINHLGGSLIDDHLPLSRGGIPTIDIVECNNIQTGGFPPTWHTVEDNLDNISTSSLKAVGTVVAHVIYSETPDSSTSKPSNQCYDY